MDEFKRSLDYFCQSLAKKTSIDIEIKVLVNEKPIMMDKEVVQQLKQASSLVDLNYSEMISGAGHDAMNMAQRWSS